MFATSSTTLSPNMSTGDSASSVLVPNAAFRSAAELHAARLSKGVSMVWGNPDGSSATAYVHGRTAATFISDLEKCMEVVMNNRIAEERALARTECLRSLARVLSKRQHCKIAAKVVTDEALASERDENAAATKRDPFALVDLRARFRAARAMATYTKGIETDQAARDRIIDKQLAMPGSKTHTIIDVEKYNLRKRAAAVLATFPVPATPDNQPIRRIQPSAPKRHKSNSGGVSASLSLAVAYDDSEPLATATSSESAAVSDAAPCKAEDGKAAPSSSPDGDNDDAHFLAFLNSPLVLPETAPESSDELSGATSAAPAPEMTIGTLPSIYADEVDADADAGAVPLPDLLV